MVGLFHARQDGMDEICEKVENRSTLVDQISGCPHLPTTKLRGQK